MPEFFNYSRAIIEELNGKGYDVIFIKETVKKNFFDRIISKIDSKYFFRKFNNYFHTTINHNCKMKNVDLVLVIFGGNYLLKEHVLFLKNCFEHAKFIYYNWDSIANFPSILSFYKLFDKYYSFDEQDCKNYGFIFLPLFYIKENNANNNAKYDYGVVMTFSFKKAKGYFNILKSLPNNCSCYKYLYLGSRFTFFYNKLIHYKIFKNFKMSDFQYKKMSYDETINFYLNCKSVIDIPLENQNGLTIRTFEVLSLKRKLITTNANIRHYEFYCQDNIFVIDSEFDKVDYKFFDTPFNEECGISCKYSIKNFINTIINTD